MAWSGANIPDMQYANVCTGQTDQSTKDTTLTWCVNSSGSQPGLHGPPGDHTQIFGGP